ncbi:hypothetical protein [Amycolatopsis sp. NBC_00438]|uniref:hypothetical protein n=1 Tax=Amycolatopsis sp. NBC_00438 TaxID=2903558 RepID=UPI002E22455A
MRGPTVPLRASTVQQAVVRRALEHGLQGQRGYFSRGEDGAVTGVDLAGRLVTRV